MSWSLSGPSDRDLAVVQCNFDKTTTILGDVRHSEWLGSRPWNAKEYLVAGAFRGKPI